MQIQQGARDKTTTYHALSYMKLPSCGIFGISVSDCETGDICALLTAVLPVFEAITERIRSNLSDASAAGEFYRDFYVAIFSLLAVLVKWDPAEDVQRPQEDQSDLKTNIMKVLDQLENVFISSKKSEGARWAMKRLGFERKNETYPKLRALKRVLPHDRAMNEDFLDDIDRIIRVYKSKSHDRAKMLDTLQQALGFLWSMHPSNLETDLSCPIRWEDYPLRRVWKFAKRLFDVVQKNWSCQCCGSTSHVSRKTRLNLTHHQRFETVSPAGQVLLSSDAHWRVLFPTTSRAAEWQDTEITVTERDRLMDEHVRPQNGVCGIIQGVKAGIRPRMVVYAQRLWQLEADPERNQFSPPQVQDSQFLTLRDLLRPQVVRGAPLEFKESQDRCVVALEYMDKFMKARRTGRSTTIPDGLYRAISACIDPKESRKNVLDKSGMRRYIFARIIYPLEDSLVTAYEVKLSALHPSMRQEVEGTELGSFDHQDENQLEKLEAAREWLGHLDQVHNLFYDCQGLCATEADRTATRVKVAVLDTGLQLPEALQETYKEEGRINVQHSATFVRSTGSTTSHEWNFDHDGHGSRVGEIILRFAPSADLHVAKVFQTRADLADPSIATEVHERIEKAIHRATNEWQVDMIIMSFGFDKAIRSIRDSIDEASRAKKAPLFFAATRNDGAHKSMAWPATEMSVIGISSTTGDGTISTFNPSEGQTGSILYAFGEGVPVQVAHPNDPAKSVTKYVSGTSYATPVAAALVANLLGCVRTMVKTGSPEDQKLYGHVPEDLLRMSDMLKVLRRHMHSENVSRMRSMLPWHFLNIEGLDNNRILRDVADTLKNGWGHVNG
ncbi:hypothetical protein NW768_009699 [Fusarium equiseti]|uniref:Peptidase S8/S53 domain-containing protein n=1 Tax=Fusarium equiseti TaxID=61235 RepID=A0ABQ8R234_FUSEQ|nr:hypothetical protein NW768_009699 [Fusarium equiseti]